jgi:hypothetical protein
MGSICQGSSQRASVGLIGRLTGHVRSAIQWGRVKTPLKVQPVLRNFPSGPAPLLPRPPGGSYRVQNRPPGVAKPATTPPPPPRGSAGAENRLSLEMCFDTAPIEIVCNPALDHQAQERPLRVQEKLFGPPPQSFAPPKEPGLLFLIFV